MYEYNPKLLKLVVDNTPRTILGLLVVSLVFVWVYMDYIPFEYLLLWGLAQTMFIVARYVNGKKLSRYIEEDNEVKLRLHTIFFTIIVLISSVIWGGGTILGAMFAPTPYEFVSFAMIIGIIAVAMLSLTPTFRVFLGYFSIMILSQIAIMISFGTHAHLSIAAFSLVTIPVIVSLSRAVYDNHSYSIDIFAALETHNDELKELSITDSLTKVYNRRHFFETAKTLVSIAKREKNEISFLMIDIDFFKKINDTYGHQVGDYVLVKLATEIRAMTRESDVFARIGGEEFALLLHATSLEGSKIIAEKIRSKVEKLDFEDEYLPADLTVSIGCASLIGKTSTLEELYHEADKKLYVAKEFGRNRVQ